MVYLNSATIKVMLNKEAKTKCAFHY